MAYLNPNSSNQIRIRDGKVTPITIPEDQLKYLNQVLESNRYGPLKKEATIRKVMGGNCCICRGVPMMQVSYSLDHASRIERYCDKCLKNVFAREQVL